MGEQIEYWQDMKNHNRQQRENKWKDAMELILKIPEQLIVNINEPQGFIQFQISFESIKWFPKSNRIHFMQENRWIYNGDKYIKKHYL